MQRKVQAFISVLAVILFLAGAAVLCYPAVSGYLTDRSIEQTAAEFLSRIELEPYREQDVVVEFFTPTQPEETAPREYAALWEAMADYNAQIYEEKQAGLSSTTAYAVPSFDLADFGLDGEIFGVISIPALELEMPLLLGASPEHMAAGAAVLSQTSMPIGGENTNAVIAGHRGWQGANYFRYIPDLHLGDKVIITNLWESLTYEVVGTKIIWPDDLDKILIREGKDMITLLTCHPYASGGKQRFLIYCERSE